MRGGALRCRFVHFEFTGTCPPPALRSLEPCSHQGVHRNLINVSKEQNYSWLGNLQHSGECTLCEVSSHLVKILHSGCKPGTDHTVAGLGFLLSARVLAGTSGSTLCLRFGVRRRGDERKRTAFAAPADNLAVCFESIEFNNEFECIRRIHTACHAKPSAVRHLRPSLA